MTRSLISLAKLEYMTRLLYSRYIFNRSNYFLSPTAFSLHFCFSSERRTETIRGPVSNHPLLMREAATIRVAGGESSHRFPT